MEYRILVLQHEQCTNIQEFATKMDEFVKSKNVHQLTISYVGEPNENPLAYMYAVNNKCVKIMSQKGNPKNKCDIDFLFTLCKKAGKRKNVVFEVVICNHGDEQPMLTNDLYNMCIANDIAISTFTIISNINEKIDIKELPNKQSKTKTTSVPTKETCTNRYTQPSKGQKSDPYKKRRKSQPTGDFPSFIKDALQKKKTEQRQERIIIPAKNQSVKPTTLQTTSKQITSKSTIDTKKQTKESSLINKHAFFITGNPDGVNTTYVQQYVEKLINKYEKDNVVIMGGGTNRIEFIARDVATLHNVEFIDIPLKSSDRDCRMLQIRKIAYMLSKYNHAELICFHVGDGFGAQNDLINLVKENDWIKVYYPKADRDDLFAEDSKKLHFRSKIQQENPNFVINKNQNENFVIVTGDYNLRNYEAFSYLLTNYIKNKQLTNVSIVTAHNDGIDSMARRYAIEHNHGLYTFIPNLLTHDTNIKDNMCNMANLSLFCYEHVYHHALVVTTGKVKGTRVAITIINSKNIKPDIYMCPLKKYVDIDTIMYKPERERQEIVVEESWI